MKREAHKSTSFEEAERWNKEQMWAMTPDERLAIAKELRDRFYGKDAPDVREAERCPPVSDRGTAVAPSRDDQVRQMVVGDEASDVVPAHPQHTLDGRGRTVPERDPDHLRRVSE